ncbi:MAG: hypothetical protein ABS76_18385 [Pelagibacterium sp. SCN 64-44]|nr:MAG: hypothetical protein ABS76_18385 [Pelagibacterium sp. SCN 64-44]
MLPSRAWDPIPDQPIAESMVIGVLLMGLCILGIQTRLIFSLASIWPANAFLLGILLIRQGANRPLTWLLAGLGYVLADLLSGSSLTKALALNSVNLVGVGMGLMAFRAIGPERFTLTRPLDTINVVLVMAAAASGAAAGGAIAGHFLFDMDWLASYGLWFSAELVNYAIFLPVALATLSPDPDKFRFASRNPAVARVQVVALSLLVFSTYCMHWFGGPGAPAYVVPCMLWCAVCFRPFASAILAMLTCTWILIAGPLGYIRLNIDMLSATDAASFRLGVMMVCVGAFAVSVINDVWRRTNLELRHLATHDALTELRNRRAFMDALAARIGMRLAGPFSLLMLDIDHFKRINDEHGHPVGDRVLVALAQALRRTGLVCGRLGGEEFALLVEGPLADPGLATAESVLAAVREIRVPVSEGSSVGITVSIGIAEWRPGEDASSLLTASDSALYTAKRAGRDRIASAQHPLPLDADCPIAPPAIRLAGG